MLSRFARRLTAGSAILGLGVLGTTGVAAAATIHPLTAHNCGAQYNYTTCIYIYGSGSLVTSWNASSTDDHGTGESRFVSLDGPNSFHVCSGNTVTNSTLGSVSSCSKSPDENEPTGTYCARTYVLGNGSGYFTDGTDCTNVTS